MTHHYLRHSFTHHKQSSLPTSKWRGRTRCSDCQRLYGKKDQIRAAMAYRATPFGAWVLTSAVTDVEKNTSLPKPSSKLDPKRPELQAFSQDEEGKCKQAAHYTTTSTTVPATLPELISGQKVWITTEEAPGTVLRSANTPRSYLLD